MATTDIDLCSQALIRLGESPISSFSDGTDAATICANNYPTFKEFILEMHDWFCAKGRSKLTRSDTSPINEHAYAYHLPTDFLRLVAVYDSAGTGHPIPMKDYELFGRTLETDKTAVWIEYIGDLDESLMPGYLKELIISGFAAEIAIPVTDQVNMQTKFARDAWGASGVKGDNGGLFKAAKRADRVQQPTKVVEDYTLVTARG